MVQDGHQHGGETHRLGALGQSQGEQPTPAVTYQQRLNVLAGKRSLTLSLPSKYAICGQCSSRSA